MKKRSSDVTSGGRNSALAAFLGVSLAAGAACAASAATADDLSKGVPSREALQRKTALKLAGLATFVASSCPDLGLDSERFKAALSALGVAPKDLDDQSTKFAYLEYTMAYKRDVKANCARARAEFGPQGKTLPDLFRTVEAAPKPPAAGLPAPAAKAPEGKAPGGKASGGKAPDDRNAQP